MDGTRLLRRLSVAGLLALVAIAAPVQAHAWLLSSDPAANSHVAEAPPSVVLRFTENVEREYTGATVEDLEGHRVDDDRVLFYPEGHRNEIVVPLQTIGDGKYLVRWRTLSVDAHTADGAFLFAVGNATLEGGEVAAGGHVHGPGQPGFWTESVARSVFYAGIAAALGMPLFLLAVWHVGAPPGLDARPTRAARVAFVLTLAGALAGAFVLAAFADRIDASTTAAAQSTRTGQYLAGRIAALTLAAALLAVAAVRSRHGLHRAQPFLAAALVAALATALLTSLSSHAAAVRQTNLPFLSDLLHVVAGSVWLGGLLTFALVLPGLAPEAAGRLVRRFSLVAMAAVGALLLTGVYAGLLHVRSMAELTGTLYGRAVLLKAALLLVLMGFGAWNQFRLGPRLRARHAASGALRRTVAAEAGLLALVLLAAGVLSTTAPPAGGPGGPPESRYVLEKALTTVHLVVKIAPNPVQVGLQNLTIELHPLDPRKPVPASTEVFLKFQPPNSTEPDAIVTPERSGPSEWFLHGGYFTERGQWTLYVIVQGPEYAKTPFQVNVQ
jgi:copper transport protein